MIEENTAIESNSFVPGPYKFKFINKSACKRFAMEFAKVNRPANKFSRVSEEFLVSCEIALRNHIQSRIRTHPSNGKTLQ